MEPPVFCMGKVIFFLIFAYNRCLRKLSCIRVNLLAIINTRKPSTTKDLFLIDHRIQI